MPNPATDLNSKERKCTLSKSSKLPFGGRGIKLFTCHVPDVLLTQHQTERAVSILEGGAAIQADFRKLKK